MLGKVEVQNDLKSSRIQTLVILSLLQKYIILQKIPK